MEEIIVKGKGQNQNDEEREEGGGNEADEEKCKTLVAPDNEMK
jgi:hypothetical protein